MKQCKAQSKRTHQRCKNPAMKGMEVCYHHGGVLGSKKAREARRQGALRHGLYTKEAIQERKHLQSLIKESKENLSSYSNENAF